MTRRTPATRRRTDLPLLLLLPLAIGAVLAERLRGRGLAFVAGSLLLCVTLSGFGVALNGRASGGPGTVTAPRDEAPEGAQSVVAMPPGDLTADQSVGAPTMSPAPTARPTAAPAARATESPPSRQAARQPVPTLTPTAVPTVAPTAAPPTPVSPTPTLTINQATPRGTTVIPILMYHYVRVVTDPKDTIGIGLSVPPERFAAQMQYLADKGYTTLTMADVYAILAGQQPLPPKPIALTFDDGYRDFYTAAWPILKAHNFKATSYVVSGFIGWPAYMSWEMLRELDASGLVEIGAHTQGHVDLAALGGQRSMAEIAGSKTVLEQGLGHPVTAFCYPSGKYNAAVAAQVKQAGFLTATTVEYGARLNIQNAYTLPRVRVNGPDSLAAWIGKLP